jgi:hypothetical protein
MGSAYFAATHAFAESIDRHRHRRRGRLQLCRRAAPHIHGPRRPPPPSPPRTNGRINHASAAGIEKTKRLSSNYRRAPLFGTDGEHERQRRTGKRSAPLSSSRFRWREAETVQPSRRRRRLARENVSDLRGKTFPEKPVYKLAGGSNRRPRLRSVVFLRPCGSRGGGENKRRFEGVLPALFFCFFRLYRSIFFFWD